MYNLNIHDPTTASIGSLVVSFILIISIMSLVKPDCVQVIDKKGNKSVSSRLLLSYSLTFSLVIAITVLLLKTQRKKGVSNNLAFNTGINI